MTAIINSDNRLADMLLDLKRHLRTCRDCQAAVKVRDETMMCRYTIRLILAAVTRHDSLISHRLAVKRTCGNVFYACPDISAHGKVWAMTAEPLVASGVQEGLF